MPGSPVPFVTKLLAPRARADVVRRPRLLDFLHDHLDRKLLLVCAPAGYGKTTLLAQFTHEAEGHLPVCWYTLDASDRDPRVFLEYLIASIARRFPAFGGQTRRALEGASDLRRDLGSVVGTLVNEIHEEIPDLFVVVLDDYQWVDEGEEVNQAVDLLLRYLPDNCRLMIASRTIPGLTLSRLAATREVAGVGTSDLRFAPEELEQLLAGNFKLLLRPGQAEALVEQTEGWITGILLSTHSLSQGIFGSVLGAKESDERLSDFLTREVLERQEPEVQSFLLETALLRRLNPEVCDALRDRRDSADILDYLESANLFTTRLEGTGRWYRYHQLFREFLVEKLRQENPRQWTSLGRRAAALARERGEVEEAIGYLLAIEEFQSAAALIQQIAEDMVARGRWQTVAEWIDALPGPLLERRPLLLLIRAQIWRLAGDLDRSVALCSNALALASVRDDRRLGARVHIARCYALRFKGLYQEAIADVRKAMELLDPTDTALRADAYQHLGTCLGMQGLFAEAITELERARDLAEKADDLSILGLVLMNLARALSASGRLAEAVRHYERARVLFETRGDVGRLGLILVSLGMTRYYQGDHAGASESFIRARTKAQHTGSLRTEAYAEISLADVQRDQGDYDAALAAYERGLGLARQLDEPELVAFCLDAMGQTYRALGMPMVAEKLVRQALRLAQERQADTECATYECTLAILKCEAGQAPAALTRLRRASAILESRGAPRALARARLYAAQALWQMGRREEALTELARVDALCTALGHDAFLWFEARRCGPLFRAAAEQPFGDRFRRAIERVGDPARLLSAEPLLINVRGGAAGRSLEVRALGEARVVLEGRPLHASELGSQAAFELLYLLLSRPAGLRKEQIAEALWGHKERAPSRSLIPVTAHRLRRALWPQAVVSQGDRYRFEGGEHLWYDVAEFERLVDEASILPSGSDQRIAAAGRAVELYRGPFLADFDSPWCEPVRQHLEKRFKQVASLLANDLIAAGERRRAVALFERILTIDPFDESAHERMLRLLAGLGERAAAALHYQRYVARLMTELGTVPGRRIQRLYQELTGSALAGRSAG